MRWARAYPVLISLILITSSILYRNNFLLAEKLVYIASETVSAEQASMYQPVVVNNVVDLEDPHIDIEMEVDFQERLEKVIEDAVRKENGQMSVKVQQLYGEREAASYREEIHINPYSTYKLFIAWLVLQEVEQRNWIVDKIIFDGQNVETCLRKTIVVSDNGCAEAFIDHLGGRGNVERRVRMQGYVDTKFVYGLDSTVSDQVAFLTDLFDGKLLGPASTEHLLDLMLIQQFRDGIPAGTTSRVANKVGFTDDYLHDIGVVWGERGPYIVGIYTKGSSWAGISRVAAAIHEEIDK